MTNYSPTAFTAFTAFNARDVCVTSLTSILLRPDCDIMLLLQNTAAYLQHICVVAKSIASYMANNYFKQI